MATNPKPTRQVRTTSARTPDGKKVIIQKSNKTLTDAKGKKYKDSAVVATDGSRPIDKNTNERVKDVAGKTTYGMFKTRDNRKSTQNLGELKRTVRKGLAPGGAIAGGKAKAPVDKNYKEGPSFKKKKP